MESIKVIEVSISQHISKQEKEKRGKEKERRPNPIN
jgi:hypothetical protein